LKETIVEKDYEELIEKLKILLDQYSPEFVVLEDFYDEIKALVKKFEEKK